MKLLVTSLLVVFGVATTLAQVKIGNNPQNINAFSLLELESTDKALVISRVNNSQMQGMTPLRGALVFNTDEACVFHYTGTEWESLCQNTTNTSFELLENDLVLTDSDGTELRVSLSGAINPNFTTVPTEPRQAQTIVITQDGDNYNFEIFQVPGSLIANNSILGSKIADETIEGRSLNSEAVTNRVLALNAVTTDKIEDGTILAADLADGSVTDNKLDKANIPISGFGAANAAVDLGGQSITNLADPTNLQDAATKNYVDNLATGLSTLADGTIFVGDAANTAQSVSISGDANLDNLGELTITDNAITTTKILDGNVTPEKLSAGTAGQILVSDGSVANWQDPAVIAVTTDGTTIVGDGDATAISVANDGITTDKILDGEVQTADIANGNVTPEKLSAGTDGQVLIANGGLVNWQDNTAANVAVDAAAITNLDAINVQDALAELQGDVDGLTLAGGADGVITNVELNAANELEFTGNNGGFNGSVNLDGLANTDEQDLSLAGNTLNISGGIGVDLTPILGGANTDEQQLTLEPGNLLTLTNGGTPIDLTPFLDNQTATEVPFTTYLTINGANAQLALQQLKDELDAAILTGGGEVNTGSNQGTAGVPTFIQKNGADLEFRSINAGSNKIIITDDVANNEIDIDIDETQLTITEAQISDLNHTVNTDNQNDFEVLLATPTDFDGDLNNETTVQGALNAIAAISSDDQNDSEVLLATPTDFDGDLNNETTVQGALNAIAAISSDDQNDSEVLLATPTDFDGDLNNETTVQGALNAIAAISSDDQNDSEVLLATPTDFDGDLNNETTVQGALNAIAAISSDDQNDSEVLLATPTDFDGDLNNETTVQGALNAIAAISSDDQNDSEVLLATPTDFDGDLNNETTVQGALNAIAAISSDDQNADEVVVVGANPTNYAPIGGTNVLSHLNGIDAALATATVSGTEGSIFFADTDGTVTDENAQLFWDNANDRLGVGTNTPESKLQVDGLIRATGFRGASNGSNNTPTYRFSEDANTGIYNPSPDNLGFVTGTNEAMLIDATQNVIVNQNLQLDGTLTDNDGNVGTDGQILSKNGDGDVVWSDNAAIPSGLNQYSIPFVNATGDGWEEAVNINGGQGFYWRADKRSANGSNTGTKYGALFIGIDQNFGKETNHAKVQIADNAPGLGYALQLTNYRAADGNNNSTGILFSTEQQGTWGKGALVYQRNFATPGYARGDFHFLQNQAGDNTVPDIADAVMTIKNNGNVGIGTTAPEEKLHVVGNIRAEGGVFQSVTNTIQPIPDYVFQKHFLGSSSLKADYEFKSLAQIERFVKENHHLPGVTSAKEAQANGVWNLSQSNLQNLEKIEELFLHTIAQEKKIQRLEAEKKALHQEVESLKKDMAQIKAVLLDLKK
ncbi:hypothetical protein [Croceivirga sp. JEA036]|uniref:hypothetical protein n=1 Tax=Croceivirga sp. JEA036 TaxID=2721162 RepID=UPI00143BE95C|nr:hypothetical protein [Croceivirga sp. JEA036]NJB36019.1 hypothetical protein [Croceivirga sp. JEA036]